MSYWPRTRPLILIIVDIQSIHAKNIPFIIRYSFNWSKAFRPVLAFGLNPHTGNTVRRWNKVIERRRVPVLRQPDGECGCCDGDYFLNPVWQGSDTVLWRETPAVLAPFSYGEISFGVSSSRSVRFHPTFILSSSSRILYRIASM